MSASTSQDDEQNLEFLKKKEQSLKYIQIKAEIARSQKQKETEKSRGNVQHNIGAGNSEDWNNRYELIPKDE